MNTSFCPIKHPPFRVHAFGNFLSFRMLSLISFDFYLNQGHSHSTTSSTDWRLDTVSRRRETESQIQPEEGTCY